MAFREQVQGGSFRPSWTWLAVCAFLMPFNWYLEVCKWQNFFAPELRPSFRVGLRAVLGGVSLSFLTPNRSGEYAARILVSPSGLRWPAAYATLGAAYCQLAVLLAMGLPALALFLAKTRGSSASMMATLLPGIVIFCGVLALGLLLRPLLYLLEQRGWNRFFGSAWAKIAPLGHFSRFQVLRGLFLALLRYVVYGTQYYAMLRFSTIALSPVDAFAGVGTIYLIHTGLPFPPLLGFLARGEIALLVWQAWGIGPVQALTATYGLFIINLAVPALIFLGLAGFPTQLSGRLIKWLRPGEREN